ncbi:MAG: hypothetical protein LBR73_09360 [Oscillospiraceae bacterium]|jgi:hypothetical protein|nr:hypothetical protein [Oscillospiraceae bacterium]
MLYPEAMKPALTPEVFENPGCEYRAAPFWAWNTELNQDTLNREIDYMKEMGFGGFHMHVRVGMDTPYLTDRFMGFIRGCAEKAKANQMLAWAYDEDKWPSGFAGGLVTKDVQNREKYLLFTAKPYAGEVAAQGNDSSGRAHRAENGTLLAAYAVKLNADGTLAAYRRLADTDTPGADESAWYAYLETQQPSDWFNLQTYVDTLSPSAMQKFLEVTHDRYAETVGEYLGNIIPAIFTDEPQFAHKGRLEEALTPRDITLPWTTDFAQTFQAAYGFDLMDYLPEIYWELPDGRYSAARYDYHDHVSERFAQAFADQCGKWCADHGMMLTGHMMEEDNLQAQTAAIGDCMRSYRGFQLPGIDLLCDSHHLTTAKQAQSAARQYGRPGVLSELYGVTNWDFPFRRHKLQGDWQAALGITVRVPHLYWVSMRGEAKRDYPASIGHQSPWYKEYKYVEDHFARVNAAMTRGKALVDIAVIHPVESYWLHWGPAAETAEIRDRLNREFLVLADWLLYNLTDFDYVCESLLPTQFQSGGEGFRIGEMTYKTVLVPNCETLRQTTLDALQDFKARGGQVIFLGLTPTHIDARPEPSAALSIRKECTCLPMEHSAVLAAVKPWKRLTVKNGSHPVQNVISQRRQDTDCEWLFLAHVRDADNPANTDAERLSVEIDGAYDLEVWDTQTGMKYKPRYWHEDGKTAARWIAYRQDSLLLKLTPAAAEVARTEEGSLPNLGERTSKKPSGGGTREVLRLPAKVAVKLAEPNVLVLDMPEWQIDGGAWQPREEMLRIGDTCKSKLQMHNAIAGGCQPWVLLDDPEAVPTHTLKLRHTIHSTYACDQVQLAIEDLETLTITFNGQAVDTSAPLGDYVDESIRRIALGALPVGDSVLEVTIPFGKITTVENCFLLGDFGVTAAGDTATVTAPVREIAFGDYSTQGLAFYGGNLTYIAEIDLPADGEYALEAAHFKQPALHAYADGKDCGMIAYAPYTADLGHLTAGRHTIELTAFGNRINTFGSLHNYNYTEKWHGPGAWRKDGNRFGYTYRLRECGVTVEPRVLKA